MANERVLVCRTCQDVPFEHNRTILIPADPVPIANPRPEYYVVADNPISPLSFSPLSRGATGSSVISVSANLGSMNQGGGIGAAYTGGLQKPYFLSALFKPSIPGTNWIAKNWSAVPGLMPVVLPTVMSGQLTALRYAVSSFTAMAPVDQSFLGLALTNLQFFGWDGQAWTVLWSGSSKGTRGEVVTVVSSQLANTNPYYAHAFGVLGDGLRPAAVASLQINANAEGLLSPLVAAPSAPVMPFPGYFLQPEAGSYSYGAPGPGPAHTVVVGAGSYAYTGA